jgi:hypothetical protein
VTQPPLPLDEWNEILILPTDPALPLEPKVVPSLLYPDLPSFVAEQLAPSWRRQTGPGLVWCRQWWKHPEAVQRLEALWRAFEHLRHDPALGMSVWWRDHVDPHMAALTNPDGPMKGCYVGEREHVDRLDALPVEPPPDGLFG